MISNVSLNLLLTIRLSDVSYNFWPITTTVTAISRTWSCVLAKSVNWQLRRTMRKRERLANWWKVFGYSKDHEVTMEDKGMLKGILCVFLLTTVNVHVPFKVIVTLMEKKTGKGTIYEFYFCLFFSSHHSILQSKMLKVVYCFAKIQDKAPKFRQCLFKNTLKNKFHC